MSTNSFTDLLGRRLSLPATYASALRLSPDGRIALSIGDSVSVVYSRGALQAPTFDPVSFQELLDETQRKARGVRTPAVSHVLVDDQPARALVWVHPPVLLSAPAVSSETLRRLVPPFSTSTEDMERLEGSWGLSNTLWQVISGSGKLLNNHVCRRNTESTLNEEKLRESTECRNQRTSARRKNPRQVIDSGCDDSDTQTPNRKRVKKEPKHHCASENIVETKLQVEDEEVAAVEERPMESQSHVQSQVSNSVSRLIVANSFSKYEEPRDILSMSVFNLNAANGEGYGLQEPNSSMRVAAFIALGFRNGVIVRRWNDKNSPMGRECRIWDEWACSLEAVETIDMVNAPGAILAVGGTSGNVRVFSLIWVPTENNDEHIEVIPVWNGADSVLRGPVASFGFRFPSHAPNCLLLAIAIGNSVAGVRIDKIDDCGRKMFKARVSLAYDAHYQSVSSVCFLPDGSVLSSSKDGSISRWKFEWEDNTEPCTPLGVIQQPSLDLDSIVAMRPTPSCLLVVTLTTRPFVKGEVGEPSTVVKKKYHYLGRPTLLSILAYPIGAHDEEGLREGLENSIGPIIERGRYADLPLSLWDVELWLLANKQHMNLAETILREKFQLVSSHIKEANSQCVRNRLRKVAHCIASVLDRCVTDFGMNMPLIQESKATLCLSILVDYHFGTLCRFSHLADRKSPVNVSQFEQESLMAKLNFVLSHQKLLENDHVDVHPILRDIGTKLSTCFRETTRNYTLCDICEDVPLVARTDDPSMFRCINGDSYPRCSMTALPATECVPRICSGCGVRARTEIVHYDWSPDPLLCPICNCEVVQGRAEDNS